MKHVVALSGGKDSTAMALRLAEVESRDYLGSSTAKEGEGSMTFSNELWSKFAESKEFREEYAAALVKRAFAFQVRTLRKGREMSQEDLADAAKIDQAVISRAENPNYGNLTFNTGIRVASGFDLVFIPQIVTYSEFLKWAEKIGEGLENLKSFEKETGNDDQA